MVVNRPTHLHVYTVTYNRGKGKGHFHRQSLCGDVAVKEWTFNSSGVTENGQHSSPPSLSMA